MLQKFRDALLCLLLVVLLIGCVVAEWWVSHRAYQVDVILVNLSSATYNASSATYQANQTITASQKPLGLILRHADEAVGETARTAKHIAAASQDWANEQHVVSQATLGVIANTARTMNTLDDQIERVGNQARFTLSGLETVSKTANVTLSDLDRTVNDPNIAAAFGDIHGATTEFGGTMANMNATSLDVKNYVHRLTQPPSRLKSIGLHALGFSEGVVAHMIP